MSLERDIASAGVWHDAGGLMGLRRAARDDADGALQEAARQFEALFVGQMFSAMRATVPDDGPLASDEEKHWQGLLDRQLSLDLTRGSGTGSGSGFGLADTIVRQLGDRGDAGAAAGSMTQEATAAMRLEREVAVFALDRAGRSRVAAARDGAAPETGPQAVPRGADTHGMPGASRGDAAASRTDRK